MTCTRLCKKIGIGSHAYIEGAKNCSECVLFLITESDICACVELNYDIKILSQKKTRFSHLLFGLTTKGYNTILDYELEFH